MHRRRPHLGYVVGLHGGKLAVGPQALERRSGEVSQYQVPCPERPGEMATQFGAGNRKPAVDGVAFMQDALGEGTRQ